MSSAKATPGSAALTRGDTIGVVATGFAVKRALLEAGTAALGRMGFRVRLGRHVLDRHGYLAGDDEARAADLVTMLRDPEVRAIWFARGGYGTARLLDRIPWAKLRARPKLLVGYSDLTALFAAAVDRCGARCLYGPVVTELGRPEAFHRPSLRRGLAAEPIERHLRKADVLVEGRARGRLFGGNLSVLTHLAGTRYAPRPTGGILFLEEVGEQAYRIDRMLTQLRTAGLLDGVRAVLLGRFAVPGRRRFPPDREWLDVVGEVFRPLGIPIVRGLPAGHMDGKWSLPLGATAELDTGARRLRLGA